MDSYSVPSSPLDRYGHSADTDSSAESAYSHNTQSAASSPFSASRRLADDGRQQPQHPAALPPSSRSSPSSLLLADPLPSSSSSVAGSVESASGGATRPARTKDRLKHSESENRRRTRLRHKFSLLRDAASCVKKDRYNILSTAITRLHELQQRQTQAEHEKAALLLSINQITSQQQRQQQQQQQQSSAPAAPPPASSSLPKPLSPLSSLSYYPLLSSLSAAFISLDGRILDCNASFCQSLRFSKEEVMRSTLFALCEPSHLLELVVVLKRLLDGSASSWEWRRWCVTKEQERVLMHHTLSTVRHEGRIVFFLLIMVPAVDEQQQRIPLPSLPVQSSGEQRSDGVVLEKDERYGAGGGADEGSLSFQSASAFPSPPASFHTLSSMAGSSAQDEAMQMLASGLSSSSTSSTASAASSPSRHSFLSSPSHAHQQQYGSVASLSSASSASMLSDDQQHAMTSGHPASSSTAPAMSGLDSIVLKREWPSQAPVEHLSAAAAGPPSSSPSSSSYPGSQQQQQQHSLYSRLPSSPHPSYASHLPQPLERPPSTSSLPSAAGVMSFPAPHRRPPPSSISTSSASFSRHSMPAAHSQSLTHSQPGAIDSQRGWSRPSMSAPNSPAAMKPSRHLQQQQHQQRGLEPSMPGRVSTIGGYEGSLDWALPMYSSSNAAGPAADAGVSRQRAAPLVDMRC